MLKFNANASNAISLRHMANTLANKSKKELINTMTEEFRANHEWILDEIEDFKEQLTQMMKIFTINIDTKYSNKSLEMLLEQINEQIKFQAKTSWTRIVRNIDATDKITLSYKQLYDQYNKYNLNGMSLKEMTDYSRDYRDQRLNELNDKPIIALNEIGNIMRIDHCTNKELLFNMIECSKAQLKKQKTKIDLNDLFLKCKEIVFDKYAGMIRKEITSKLQKNEDREKFIARSKDSLETSFKKISKKYIVEMEKLL